MLQNCCTDTGMPYEIANIQQPVARKRIADERIPAGETSHEMSVFLPVINRNTHASTVPYDSDRPTCTNAVTAQENSSYFE